LGGCKKAAGVRNQEIRERVVSKMSKGQSEIQADYNAIKTELAHLEGDAETKLRRIRTHQKMILYSASIGWEMANLSGVDAVPSGFANYVSAG